MKKDVFIIGAGIAGLTAAVYSINYGMDVYLCEENFPGGNIALATNIDNYPAIYGITGADFSSQLYSWFKKSGGKIYNEKTLSVEKNDSEFIITTDKNTISSKTVIAANGTKRRNLNCKGEADFIGKGISWCSMCDGAFFKGKKVAVIGDGNTALGEALHLSDICSEVFIVAINSTLTASPLFQKKIQEKSNIKVLKSHMVTEFFGNSNLEGIKIKSCKDNATKELYVSGVFEAIGTESDNSMFISLVEFDETGHIITNKYCQTKTPGFYAAGDNRSQKYRQLVIASSDGCVAASEAYSYITGI